MPDKGNWFSGFSNNIIRLFIVFLLFLLLFGVFRILFLISSENITDILSDKKNLFAAFSMGFRFDSSCIFYGLIPVAFVFLIGLFFYKSSIYNRFSFHFSIIYSTILFTLFLFISTIDFFFYQYFQSHINIAIFGFFEDNTSALLKTFWTDYPVIPVFAGLAVFIVCCYFLMRKIMSVKFSIPQYPYWIKICIVILFIGIFIEGVRGFSFKAAPLRLIHSEVTLDSSVNSLVLNGVFALKTAIKDKISQEINSNLNETVKESGFPSINNAVSYYVNHQVINNEDSLRNALFTQTPENLFLKENPPHVVFILMEGMGTNLWMYHDKDKLNLLGELEDVLPYAYVFKNFTSSTQSTITSLESLMINNTFKTSIAQSTFANDSLHSSVAYVFKQKGYTTNFVTSGNFGWRNLDDFIPRQYFDTLVDAGNLDDFYPNVEKNDWGCYDEFMFDYIYDELKQNQNYPQFIFGLTTTNHSPFHLPKSYKPYPIDIKQINRKILFDDKVAKIHFTTYQYANDCLGRLIKRIKASSIGDNTIIVVTGDHCVRGLFDYSNTELLTKYGVPLLLFVPEKYKPAIHPDLTNFGSHKDVFPTIFNLALSNASYLKSGVNLFSDEANDNFALHLSEVVISKNGSIDFSLKPIFFTWDKNNKLTVQNNGNTNDKLYNDLNEAKASIACMRYFNQTEWKRQNK